MNKPIINETLVPRDNDFGIVTLHRDICPHISVAYKESDEYYFFGADAIFYCKLCQKEYTVANGVPE